MKHTLGGLWFCFVCLGIVRATTELDPIAVTGTRLAPTDRANADRA